MWIYPVIFIAKMIEVSMATIRNVLVNRGEKIKAAIIGFFEVMIWLIVISNVLQTITQDPFKVLVYCLAYALGNYFGVIIENKLAIGTACIQAVVGNDETEAVSRSMRERGFGVTTVQGYGKDGPVKVLMIYLKRKCLDEAIAVIKENSPNAMITINDVRQLRNGYIRK